MTPLNGVLIDAMPAQASYLTMATGGGNVTVALPTAAVTVSAQLGSFNAYDPMVFTAACSKVVLCLGRIYACMPAPDYCEIGEVESVWQCPNGASSCWSHTGGSTIPLFGKHAVVFESNNAAVYAQPGQFDDLQHIVICFALMCIASYSNFFWLNPADKTTRVRRQYLHLNWVSAIATLLVFCSNLRLSPTWCAPLVVIGATAVSIVVWFDPSKGALYADVTRLTAYAGILLNLPERSIGVQPATFARFILGFGSVIDCAASADTTLPLSCVALLFLATWNIGCAIYPQVIEASLGSVGSDELIAVALGLTAIVTGQIIHRDRIDQRSKVE